MSKAHDVLLAISGHLIPYAYSDDPFDMFGFHGWLNDMWGGETTVGPYTWDNVTLLNKMLSSADKAMLANDFIESRISADILVYNHNDGRFYYRDEVEELCEEYDVDFDDLDLV